MSEFLGLPAWVIRVIRVLKLTRVLLRFIRVLIRFIRVIGVIRFGLGLRDRIRVWAKG